MALPSIIFSVFLGLSESPSFAMDLNNLSESCDTYYDIENSLRCGYQSYIRKFAIPYCQDYLNSRDSLSLTGQVVTKNIRACLQLELLENLKKNMYFSCDNIQSIGIRSHYKCYIESGFCQLPNQDLFIIMWIAKRQVFNAEVMNTFLDVVAYCRQASTSEAPY